MSNTKSFTKTNTGVKRAFGQGGAAMTDKLIWIGIVVMALLFIFMQYADITYQYRKVLTTFHVGKITAAAQAWKKTRANYTGLTNISILCADSYLSESICGAGGNGVNANMFGGNYTVAVNTNPGLINIAITMPNDADRVNDMADTLASGTRGECTSRTGCATLTAAATTITGTY